MKFIFAATVGFFCLPLCAQTQSTVPSPSVVVYKQIGDIKLNATIYYPENHKPSDKRAAIVFFFGGGWRTGTPTQFTEHCKYLAGRGMVAITADYRVSSRHGTAADCCVADAKSAVRWMRRSASQLGIDAERIVAGGGSAGGHIAACTGVISGWDEQGENLRVSSVPNAMALFNPALVLADIKGKYKSNKDPVELRERVNTDPVNLSPYHQLKSRIPATIIFHGKADEKIPYETAELFTARAGRKSRVELHGYEGQGHGFFNVSHSKGEYFRKTMKTLDTFLVSLGYLDPSS